jgi:hypothetical protein
MAGNLVPWPQDGTVDIGAYEFGSDAEYPATGTGLFRGFPDSAFGSSAFKDSIFQ